MLRLLHPLNDWRSQRMSPTVDAGIAAPLAELAEKHLV